MGIQIQNGWEEGSSADRLGKNSGNAALAVQRSLCGVASVPVWQLQAFFVNGTMRLTNILASAHNNNINGFIIGTLVGSKPMRSK